ncbi:hypothetical protein H1R20_g6735, partial [Candolleomyces eurysporus]
MSDAQEINYDYLGHVSARGWYANSSVTLVEVVLPALSYVASVGLGIFLVIPDPNVSSEAYASIESAWVFLSVLTNVMVTALISFQLLHTRRIMLKLLPSASSDLNIYTGAVAILIESALPLSLFGLVYASIVVATPRRSTNAYASYLSAFNTFSCLFYAFSALSPHMIIFRITTGRSWLKAPQRPTDGEFSTPIAFNHGPAEQSLVQTTADFQTYSGGKENSETRV